MRKQWLCFALLSLLPSITQAFSADESSPTQANLARTPPPNLFSRSPDSWHSPFLVRNTPAKQVSPMRFKATFEEPQKLPTAARWAVNVTAAALLATGKVEGYGTDNTGEIGKKPYAGPSKDNGITPPTIRGGIR